MRPTPVNDFLEKLSIIFIFIKLKVRNVDIFQINKRICKKNYIFFKEIFGTK